MKKLLATLLLTASLSAVAGPVFLQPTCSTLSRECTIYNSSGYDVSCNIRINGQTRSGAMIDGFEYRVLYKGMYAWLRVNLGDPQDELLYLNGYANCYTYPY